MLIGPARAVTALVLAAGVLAAATACGDGDGSDAAPASTRPATVDERRGTYRGVGIGSTRRAADRRLGRSRSRAEDPLAPLGVRTPLEVGIPPSPVEPAGRDPVAVWRFRDAAMVADRGRAWLLAVTAKDARTGRGVGVGSSLADVRDAYPDAACATVNEGTDYVRFDYCQLRTAPARYVWFGGDPVRSVTLSRAPGACPPAPAPRPRGCPPS